MVIQPNPPGIASTPLNVPEEQRLCGTLWCADQCKKDPICIVTNSLVTVHLESERIFTPLDNHYFCSATGSSILWKGLSVSSGGSCVCQVWWTGPDTCKVGGCPAPAASCAHLGWGVLRKMSPHSCAHGNFAVALWIDKLWNPPAPSNILKILLPWKRQGLALQFWICLESVLRMSMWSRHSRELAPKQVENINVFLLNFFCFDFCILHHAFLNACK